MPNLLSIKEIKDDILKSEYKSVSLRDKNGGVLIPFNSKTVKIDQRLQEIERRLASKAIKPGVYQIHAKHWEREMIPAVYYVSAGDMDLALQDIELENQPVKKRTPLADNAPVVYQGNSVSWEKYQDLLEENMELQATVTRLNMEIDQLNLELDSLEELADEPKDTGAFGLSQGTQDWVKNMMETVVPIVQKVLDQRDTQQEIQKHSLYWEQVKAGLLPPPGAGAKQPTGQPQVKPNNQEEEEEEEEGDLTEEEEILLDNFEYLKQIDPDLYNRTIATMRQHAAQGGGE